MSDVPEKVGIVDEDFINIRTEIARVLEPSAFPATGPELKAVAADNFAEQVAALLDNLPPDEVYENTQQVVDALGVNPSE